MDLDLTWTLDLDFGIVLWTWTWILTIFVISCDQDSLLDYSMCLNVGGVTSIWSESRDSISICGISLTNPIIDKKKPLKRARWARN